MLHFCSIADIQAVLASAGRYDDTYATVRNAVTMEMNRYMRRNLEYKTGMVEYFDTIDVGRGGEFTVWLEKKMVDPGSVIVNYSIRREWGDDNVIPALDVTVVPEKGKLIVASNYMRPANRGLRVVYNGGYNPIGATDTMNCPPELKNAALAECVYRLDKLLNINVGQSADVDKGRSVPSRKFIAGFLSDTVAAMTDYRKPLGN
jgi:hypothetical protein